ncbi:XRE family transcriptional regulator [Candidatus Sumerlaeota bacterium]|nr:XRE family transcriptional regulator [Candidatus Sumerlaeota bacterium]
MALRKTKNAISILDAMIGDDPNMRRLISEAEIRMDIGRKAYDAREAAGLTRSKLARRVGVKTSDIEDLEEADYDGDALSLLRRVAEALGGRVEVRFVRRRNRVATGAYSRR